MGLLGVISGTIPVKEKDFLINLQEVVIDTEFGNALVLLSNNIAFIPRHGNDNRQYILPHLINHRANIKALKSLGVNEIIGLCSTGSLKKEIKPGVIVVPDDFLVLTGTLSSVEEGKAIHITPKLNQEIRRRLLEAASTCGIEDILDGGVYWQTTGPRFETKAEIRMMSQFADIVGMTMANEAIVSQELGLPYAALCSVDNYGHGLVSEELTLEEIIQNARRNTDRIIEIVSKYLDRRKK